MNDFLQVLIGQGALYQMEDGLEEDVVKLKC